MAYAAGKKAWGISDRSGRRYRLNKMKTEWTGAKVGPDEFDPKQPQLFPPKAFPDPVGFNFLPGLSPPDNLVATGSVGTVTVETT